MAGTKARPEQLVSVLLSREVISTCCLATPTPAPNQARAACDTLGSPSADSLYASVDSGHSPSDACTCATHSHIKKAFSRLLDSQNKKTLTNKGRLQMNSRHVINRWHRFQSLDCGTKGLESP